MSLSGVVKLVAIDSEAPTPPQLKVCVAEVSDSLEGGEEVPSPQGGPPLVKAAPWTSDQEAQLRAKLAAADFPEIPQPNANCALKFHNKSSIPVLITQIYPVHGRARSVKAGGGAGIGVGVHLLNSRWRIEGGDALGIKVPEYKITSNGAHNVFIVDLVRPADVETFIECFPKGGVTNLKNGEKTVVQAKWRNAKNWLEGVHTSLKSKDSIVEAILAQDADTDAENVMQQLAGYVDHLLEIVDANEAVQTVPAPAPYNYNYNTATYPSTYVKPDPPEYAGLYNQGATCYMNSLLQGLFLTPELRYALYNWQYTPERDPERGECIPYQLQRLFCQMQLMEQNAAETDSLTKSFGWAAGDQFQQQDATELLTKLTEALETCFKGTRGDGVIKALYEGVTKDYVQCRHCKHESGTEAVFQTLNLAIRPFGGPPITSVEEGLANYFKPEDMTGDNQYACDPCGTKRDADKGIRLDKVPYVLTISLIRFDYDWEQDARVKINDMVSFPETLDMAEYLAPSTEVAAQTGGAGGAAKEEQRGFRIKEDGGEILARGSSAVTDKEGMLYDLFAICVHSGGTHGGHYFAYCKPFGATTSSGKEKTPGQWYEMNDSRVTKLGPEEWKKAFGGVTKSYSRGYQIQSSTSAYMLMYRRRDPNLNIDDVPNSIVPTYIFADQKAEEERAEAERQKKAEEYRKEMEEKRLKEAQIPVVVWYNERVAQLLPTKTHTWADLKMMIFQHFELPEDDSELRIVVHANRGMCSEGDITPIDEDDDTLLLDVDALTKYGVLQIESRVGDSPWQTQVLQDKAVLTQVLAVPTEMMLCNQDGSRKHTRWFWFDLKSRTLSWAKKPHTTGKRRLVTGATDSSAAEDPNGITIHTAQGDVTAIAPSASVASQWVDGCRALVADPEALICFTDMDGTELKHTIKLTQGSTIAEARALIASTLQLDPGEFDIKNFAGTKAVTGYTIKHLRGPGPDFGLANILTAAKEISGCGQPLSCVNLKAWIADHASGKREFVYDNTVRVWNLTKLPVQVDRLTNMGRYVPPQYKKYTVLSPGYDQMVEPDKPLDERGLTLKTIQGNTSVEDKCDDPSYNVERVSWKLSVIGESGRPDFVQDWNISAHNKQNVFVEGFGEDEAPLYASRLVFSIHKNPTYGVASDAPPPGHYKVPIYRFQGTPDDASEFIFDMFVDENMLVRDFKMELAKKLQSDATGLPHVDGTKLRVRELASLNFAGEVFVDDVPLIEPVKSFTGVERFAFSELDGPEEKVSDKQAVLTIMKFSPSSHTLGEFFEVVVEKSASLDKLRALLAERDPDIAAASDVSLGSPEKLIAGKFQKDLVETVWDTECFDWDWDRAAWIGKSTFSLAKDGDVYYYKDAGEEAMEWTQEDAQKARKRATIEKRKKKQAKSRVSEAQVVMKVARGGDGASPPVVEAKEGEVVGVSVADGSADAVQVAVPVVESAEEGEPEIGLVRTISATARQELRNSEGLSDQMRKKLDQLDQARAPTRGDRTELEGWLRENETRQEFGKIRAQRDALRQLRGQDDSVEEIPAPEDLAELQQKDLAAEKEKVEKEVEELRRELGISPQ